MIVYNNQQQLTGHCSFQEYSVLLQSPPRNNGNQGQHAIIFYNSIDTFIVIVEDFTNLVVMPGPLAVEIDHGVVGEVRRHHQLHSLPHHRHVRARRLKISRHAL